MATVYEIGPFLRHRQRDRLATMVERINALRQRAADRIERARERRLVAHVSLLMLRGQYGPTVRVDPSVPRE